MQDFFEAYSEENYTPIADTTESNLHNSCMRYGNRARNAADFYTNFAGAEILVARDGSNNVLARAVVWKNVQVLSGGSTFNGFSLIDRIYFSHAFVLEMMRRQATALGITFRKQYNDYSHTKDVVALNNRPDEGVEAGKILCAEPRRGSPRLQMAQERGTVYGHVLLRLHGKRENGTEELGKRKYHRHMPGYGRGRNTCQENMPGMRIPAPV